MLFRSYATCQEKNVEIIDLEPEALAEFQAKIYPLWDEIAQKSDVSKKLVDQLKKYLSDKGVKIQ